MGWGSFWRACTFVVFAVVVAKIPFALPLPARMVIAPEAVAVAACYAAVECMQSRSAAPEAQAGAWPS